MSQNVPARMEAALRQFEAAEANLSKLERLWESIESRTSSGVEFGSDPEYEDWCRSYGSILEQLPKIDGWQPNAVPEGLNTIGQWRFDAREVGEIDALVYAEESIEEPGRQLREYRFRLDRARRKLVREAVIELAEEVDALVAALKPEWDEAAPSREAVEDPRFEALRDRINQIETLLGSSVERPPRWGDLRRHLAFGLMCDLHDIAVYDWPAARPGLSTSLYGADEPLPVDVDDLGDLSRAKPKGPVPTSLRWESLSDEQFERLLFALISSTNGYENPEWLTHTNAPDRGRDLSVWRVLDDPLAGTARKRVIIQCKHWLSRSISDKDVSHNRDQMAHWEPPRVDVLIIATSGRFSSDAVQLIERNNNSSTALSIEPWAGSHLERVLSARPDLIAEYGLR